MKRLAVSLLLSLLYASGALACTSFRLPISNRNIVAKNFDWPWARGFITINKRTVEKRALYVIAQNRAVWISKYGSVTFNQFGREMPQGGMNEAGLVVESLALANAKYPERDRDQTYVTELQWTQYVLDRFSSVAEVERYFQALPPITVTVGMHYLVCDREKKCVAVEPIDGKYLIRRLSDPVLLTNSSYADGVACGAAGASAGGLRGGAGPVAENENSLARFERARLAMGKVSAHSRKSMQGRAAVSAASDILASVARPKTQWSFVYDLDTKRTYIRTQDAPQTKIVDLHEINFSCLGPALRLDINSPLAGNVTGSIADEGTYVNRKTGNADLESLLTHLPGISVEGIIALTIGTRCLE